MKSLQYAPRTTQRRTSQSVPTAIPSRTDADQNYDDAFRTLVEWAFKQPREPRHMDLYAHTNPRHPAHAPARERALRDLKRLFRQERIGRLQAQRAASILMRVQREHLLQPHVSSDGDDITFFWHAADMSLEISVPSDDDIFVSARGQHRQAMRDYYEVPPTRRLSDHLAQMDDLVAEYARARQTAI